MAEADNLKPGSVSKFWSLGMMRLAAASLAIILALAPQRQAAAGNLVVVELFTSQGCHYCPPADAFLATLTGQEDVLPLALHVDYWDYIGWADTFGDPRHSDRQRAYVARSEHGGAVFTPHFVIQGSDHVRGSDTHAAAAAVVARRAAEPRLRLSLSRGEGTLGIALDPVADIAGGGEVVTVRYLPRASVAIERGENAGQTFDYVNIVREWTSIGAWSGSGPLRLSTPLDGDMPVAVIVQAWGQGPILGAARLDP